MLHSGETDRNFSGTCHSGEDIRNGSFPGLDPWTAQGLTTLLCRISMAKEMMSISFKVMNHVRVIARASAWSKAHNPNRPARQAADAVGGEAH